MRGDGHFFPDLSVICLKINEFLRLNQRFFRLDRLSTVGFHGWLVSHPKFFVKFIRQVWFSENKVPPNFMAFDGLNHDSPHLKWPQMVGIAHGAHGLPQGGFWSGAARPVCPNNQKYIGSFTMTQCLHNKWLFGETTIYFWFWFQDCAIIHKKHIYIHIIV